MEKTSDSCGRKEDQVMIVDLSKWAFFLHRTIGVYRIIVKIMNLCEAWLRAVAEEV